MRGVIAAALVLIAAACGQPAAGGSAVSAALVPAASLAPLIPTVSGWTRSDVGASDLALPVPMSVAEATFTNGASEVKLSISDTALNPLVLAPISVVLTAGFWDSGPEGFKKNLTIGGYPAYEEWLKAGNHGEATALVDKRFIVRASGRGVENIDVVTKFIERVDLKKLAAAR